MSTDRQLDLAKSCYNDGNYTECLNYLMLAKRNGSIEARRFFATLLDNDQLFRKAVDDYRYSRFYRNHPASENDAAAPIPSGRILKWQQKLLDLTFRNKFLNFKETKLSVPLLFHEPAPLEDELAAGKRFYIDPLEESLRIRDFQTVESLSGDDPLIRRLAEGFSKKRLLSRLTEQELSKRLLELSRQSKRDLEESGVRTLFLAIGILSRPGDEQHLHREFRAPILLLPMKLVRQSARDKFTLERSDEDTVVNITLLEKLSLDYGFTLPGIDPDHLEEDESGVNVSLILQKFRDAASQHVGWKVTEEVWLSTFSFEKFIMWNDLKNHAQALLENPLVDHLVNHPGTKYGDSELITPEEIDKKFPYSDIYAPLSADSSQLSAVLSAAQGKTFVLHGPPGTGKSQTIANIIAECLAIRKSVLFVAEKRAALEVVYNRLSQIGLAPFCLELHSNKSGKQEVLEQFRQVLNLAAQRSPAGWDTVTLQLEAEKKSLNAYVDALHQSYPIGLSPYQAICFLVAHPEPLSFSVRLNVSIISQNEFEELKRLGRDIASDLRELPDSAWDDFRWIEHQEWTPDWEKGLWTTASNLTRMIPDFMDKISRLSRDLGLEPKNLTARTLEAICVLAGHLSRGIAIPLDLYGADWQQTASALSAFVQLGLVRDNLAATLQKDHLNSVLSLAKLTASQRISLDKGRFFVFSPEHPLHFSCDHSTDSPGWEKEFFTLAKQYADAANNLVSSVKSFFDAIGLSFIHFSEKHISDALPIAAMVISAPDLPENFFSGKWAPFVDVMKKMISAGKIRDTVREKIRMFDLDQILFFDTQSLRLEMKKNETRPKLIRNLCVFFTCRKVKKLLKDREAKVRYDALPQLLDLFDEYSLNQKQLNSLSTEYESRLGVLWNKTDANWESISSQLQWGEHLHSLAARYLPSAEDQDTLCSNIRQNLTAGPAGRDTVFLSVSKLLAEKWEKYTQGSDAFWSCIFKNIHGNSRNAKGVSLAAELLFDSSAIPAEQNTFPISGYTDLLGKFVTTHAQLFAIAEKHNLAGKLEYWWKKGVGDWDKIRSVANYLNELDTLGNDAVRGTGSSQKSAQIFWAHLLNNAERMLFGGSPLQNEIENCRVIWSQLKRDISSLRRMGDVASSWCPDPSPDCLKQYLDLAGKIVAGSADLQYWCLWRKEREKARASGLDSLVSALESRKIRPAQVPLALEHALIDKFCDDVFSSKEPLRDFRGPKHENIIANFRNFDEQYTELCRKIVLSKLAARLPDLKVRQDQPVAGTLLGILQRQLLRQRGHKPIRKLLEEIRGILFDLKPCFLMSPLSVAQFLPAASSIFDVIIFDEASQIPMEDAVGAIARGKQLIVAGDPQQLPPTTFFKTQLDDDEDDDENNIVELESLLQECLADGDGFPQSKLLWHYRSRDESLISFSNAHYYGNTLWTFPAPTVKTGTAVHFNYVENGVYDRSGRGTNQREAAAVVSEAVRLLKDPAFSAKSLGIVAFSIKQQILIEDLLDEERRKHPEIEKFFDPAVSEPVFVKNLENVQGDERDVIFFSIGYARDASGAFLMNFGPLNYEKGERRLNVAITRAKERIVVFSSFQPEEINLAKVSQRGPRDLKAFLEFAATGVLENAVPVKEPDDYGELEAEVAKFLREKNYTVKEKIGNSAYKVDLAVVSPNHPERFVLGIECDGEYYRNAGSARDRDKLRAQVLERLGWKLCRVWAPSWWKDRERAERKLLAELEEAIRTEDERLPESLPPELPPPAFEPDDQEEESPEGSPGEAADFDCGIPYPDTDYSGEPLFRTQYPDLFYEPATRSTLKRQVKCIVSREGPIVESLLQRRLAQAWGINRIGIKVSNVLDEVISRKNGVKQEDGQYVFWPPADSGISPADYAAFRRPGEGGSGQRPLDQIPLIEIKNAMLWILKQYHAFSDRDALFKRTGRIFGLNRLTEPAKRYYSLAFELLRKEGRIG